MTTEDKLYPSVLVSICNSAIEQMEEVNESIPGMKESINNFLEENSLNGSSMDACKLQMENYINVLDCYLEANTSDISDYNTLISTIDGVENLIGSVIISEKNNAENERDQAYASADEWSNRGDEFVLISPSFSCLCYLIAAYNKLKASNAETRRQMWEAKELKFDSIQGDTSGLFSDSASVRILIDAAVEGIKKAYNHTTNTYDSTFGADWRIALQEHLNIDVDPNISDMSKDEIEAFIAAGNETIMTAYLATTGSKNEEDLTSEEKKILYDIGVYAYSNKKETIITEIESSGLIITVGWNGECTHRTAKNVSLADLYYEPENRLCDYSNVPDLVYHYYHERGFSDAGIAGIIGNIQHESYNCNEAKYFDTNAASKDGFNSYGLCQWTDSKDGTDGRKTNLKKFAESLGLDPADEQTQILYLVYEDFDENTTQKDNGKSAYENIKNASDPDYSAQVMAKRFERPAFTHSKEEYLSNPKHTEKQWNDWYEGCYSEVYGQYIVNLNEREEFSENWYNKIQEEY